MRPPVPLGGGVPYARIVDLGTPLPPLRPSLDVQQVQHQGQVYFLLRDRLELAGPRSLLVPLALGPLLALLDGRRSALRLSLELEQRIGIPVDPADVSRLVAQLSDACLLEDDRATAARRAALDAYRAAPFRPPALTGGVYPAEPRTLRRHLAGFGGNTAPEVVADGITGVISPHIDYHRGGPVYALLWRAAQAAARAAEAVVIFGTDHGGGLDRITLSTPDYATPWGVLPTDPAARAALESALGGDAYADELNHRTEHSIELAAVWLHYARDGESLPIVPILCGHPANYMTAGRIDPETPTGRAIAALRGALAGRRVLAVAAADLAHVGPAFGDPKPFDAARKAAVRAADEELIAACAQGAPAVLRSAGRIDDQFRICGLAPLACLLELIGPAVPETLAYDQCPADEEGGS
ncbi:MAG: AmmeMemoRadiSam system protein B, partial [Dehalococcoidia bacterium]